MLSLQTVVSRCSELSRTYQKLLCELDIWNSVGCSKLPTYIYARGVQACAQNQQPGNEKFALKREVWKFVFSAFPSLHFGPNPPLAKLSYKSEKLDAQLITQ